MALVIAPCLIAQLTPLGADSPTAPPPLGPAVWEDTHVSLGRVTSSPLKNLFTGQVCSLYNSRIAVASALADFPVALLAIP
jgi:maltooligosyltrehalose synthase